MFRIWKRNTPEAEKLLEEDKENINDEDKQQLEDFEKSMELIVKKLETSTRNAEKQNFI